jgi:N-acetyl-anhydromuramyl-L-alanine amidase AmpD
MIKILFFCLSCVIYFIKQKNIANDNPQEFVSNFYKLTNFELRFISLYEGFYGYEMPTFVGNQEKRNHIYGTIQAKDIKHIILHNTECNLASTTKIFTNHDSIVRSHYVITEKEKNDAGISSGNVIRFAEEDKLVYHCGNSNWGVNTKLNSYSIGIEFVNLGSNENRWTNSKNISYIFDKKQVDSGGRLINYIMKKYDVNPTHLLSHQDVAFHRTSGKKFDPGYLFPWEYLYTKHNVGAWVTKNDFKHLCYNNKIPVNSDIAFMSKKLRTYGYNVDEIVDINEDKQKSINFLWGLLAFKSHFSENQSPKYKSNINFWLNILETDAKNNNSNEMYANIEKIVEYITQEDMKWIDCLVTKYKYYI